MDRAQPLHLDSSDGRQSVLLCRCAGAQVIEASTLREVESALGSLAAPVLTVTDLCALAAVKDPGLSELAARGSLTVLACHQRAVRSLLAAAGCDISKVEVLDLRSGSPGPILERLQAGDQSYQPSVVRLSDGGPGWFPVIDYDRCTHCGQCASFCLFGVYGQDPEGRVVVDEPSGCKDNCPACARVCPEAAIIFPKLEEEPLNGAEIDGAVAAQGPLAVDLDRSLGRDLYATLVQRRSKLKRRLLRREALARAERERCECMDEAPSDTVGGRRSR